MMYTWPRRPFRSSSSDSSPKSFMMRLRSRNPDMPFPSPRVQASGVRERAVPDERRRRVGGRHQAFLLRVAHDPGCFPEPLGLLAPRRHRQVVDFAQVLDHRRQQSIPRRSGQRRLLTQQLDLAFPRQVEYGPRQLVEVEPKQFALAPFRADRLRVFRQPRASRRFRSRRSSTGRTFVPHIGPMVAEGSNRPVAMPAGFFACGPARSACTVRGRLPIQVLKVTVEAGIPAAPKALIRARVRKPEAQVERSRFPDRCWPIRSRAPPPPR